MNSCILWALAIGMGVSVRSACASRMRHAQEWVRRGKPDQSFFKWLSTPEVQLDGCPRDELENDVVHYCHPEERVNYALRLDVTPEGRAMLHTAQGTPVDCGPNAWLFVLRDRTIFASDKKTDPPRWVLKCLPLGVYPGVDAILSGASLPQLLPPPLPRPCTDITLGFNCPRALLPENSARGREEYRGNLVAWAVFAS